MRSPRRILFSWAAALVGVVVAVVAGELALRAFWPQRSLVTLGMFRKDPAAGYALQPGYANFVRVPEYTTDIRIDAEGYRVPVGGADDDGELRILAIGDSFTFGVGVQEEDSWPEVLERTLQESSAGTVSVRNGGVGGYGPLRSARYLLATQAAWHPRIVIHGIYIGNDLEDTHPDDYLEIPEIRDGRMVGSGGRPLMRIRSWLRINSHLYAFARAQLYDIYRRTTASQRTRYLDSMGRTEWPERIRDVAWPAAQASIREIADWADEHGVMYLVVVIPVKYQVSDAAWEIYRRRWGLEADAFDRGRAQRIVGAFLEGNGVPFVDLLPGMLTEPDRDRLYYPLDAHWTVSGHRHAAKAVGSVLRARGWLSSAESRTRPIAVAPAG